MIDFRRLESSWEGRDTLGKHGCSFNSLSELALEPKIRGDTFPRIMSAKLAGSCVRIVLTYLLVSDL